MTTMARPHTKQAVYRAEWTVRDILDRSSEAPTVEIHGSTITVPVERKFGDLVSVQRYVDKVLALNWVRAAYDRASVPVRVRVRKGNSYAHHQGDEIAVPIEKGASRQSWAMRELVVLHELAHHLAIGHGHDARFVEVFADLVTNLIGEEAGFLLRSCCYDEGVQIG